MGLPIKRGIELIPDGMVIVPLSLGALIAPGAGAFFETLPSGGQGRRVASG
jgi:hypothetical protein